MDTMMAFGLINHLPLQLHLENSVPVLNNHYSNRKLKEKRALCIQVKDIADNIKL